MPPSSEEAEALHNFYLAYGRDDSHLIQPHEERVWMGDTTREVCQLMFPQERK
jgi:acyl-coenzyme A thioesterase 9